MFKNSTVEKIRISIKADMIEKKQKHDGNFIAANLFINYKFF